jgi:hypothetical protein
MRLESLIYEKLKLKQNLGLTQVSLGQGEAENEAYRLVTHVDVYDSQRQLFSFQLLKFPGVPFSLMRELSGGLLPPFVM